MDYVELDAAAAGDLADRQDCQCCFFSGKDPDPEIFFLLFIYIFLYTQSLLQSVGHLRRQLISALNVTTENGMHDFSPANIFSAFQYSTLYICTRSFSEIDSIFYIEF